jgi:hypothetical protein
MSAPRVASLALGLASLSCVVLPVIWAIFLVIRAIVIGGESVSDQWAFLDPLMAMPRIALIGVPLGIAGVATGVVTTRRGAGSAGLAVASVGTCLCLIVTVLAALTGADPTRGVY